MWPEGRLRTTINFSAKFQYAGPNGTVLQAGPCGVSFDAETLTVTPASGTPLVVDLGDIDIFLRGEYELTLTVYTGKRIILNQLGKTFENLCHDLLEAHRHRLLQCLLLEDLEEIARFDGFARLESPTQTFSSPAQFRLYKSNLAVLPTQSSGLQWRLADIDAVHFDDTNWSVTAESSGERLVISKLAKRTEEFRARLATASEELAQHGGETVHNLFPFLSPDQLQQAAMLLKEGRAASLARLSAIHPKTAQALSNNAVDTKLKPYFDALLAHVPTGNYYAGFKLLRKEEEQTGQEQATEAEPAVKATSQEETSEAAVEAGQQAESGPEPGATGEAPPILFWFFMPLAARPGARSPDNLVAWEATSRSGRATYFFPLVPPSEAAQLRDPLKAPARIESAIRQLNRAIVLLNFRREPIYLPDDSLQIQPRFRRYAIACRKLPELGRLRSSFLGRAIHTTPEAWQAQFESYLAKSAGPP